MSFLKKIEKIASLVPGFGVSYNIAEQPIIIDPFNHIRVPGLMTTTERGIESLQGMLGKGLVTKAQISQIELKEKGNFLFGKKQVVTRGLNLGQMQEADGTIVTYRIPKNARVSKIETQVISENLQGRWSSDMSTDGEPIDTKNLFDKITQTLGIPDDKVDFYQRRNQKSVKNVYKIKLQQSVSLGTENYPAGTILYSDGRFTAPLLPIQDYSIPVISTYEKREPVGRAFRIPKWHRVESFPTGPNPYPVRMVPATERIGLLSMRLLTGDISNETTSQPEPKENDGLDSVMLPYTTPAFDAHISVPPHLAKEVALRIAGGDMSIEGLVGAVRSQVAPVIMETAFANEVSIPVSRSSKKEPQQSITLRPAEVFALQQISTVPNLDPQLASRFLLGHMTKLSREALEENGMPGEILKRIQIATPADAGEITARVKETTESRLDMSVQGPKIFQHLQSLQILTKQDGGTPANIFFPTDGNSSAESGIGMNLPERLASLENSVRSLINEQDNI